MRYLKTYESFNTDNFKSWFGDSKVVNESGQPLIVYHGTQEDFSVFKEYQPERVGGLYFTDSLDLASDYGHNIHKVYLKIENPFIMEGNDSYFDDIADEMNSNIRYYRHSEEYDGIIVKNIKDTRDGKHIKDEEGYEIDFDSSNVYVVFNSSQIKSIDNKGEFDIKNDNIFQ